MTTFVEILNETQRIVKDSKFEGLEFLSDGTLYLLEKNVGLTYDEVHRALDVVLQILNIGGIIQMTSGRIFPVPYLDKVKEPPRK